MRFPTRQFGFFAARGKGTAPATLSTLLLAALCMLIVAPASQAASREEVHAAILTQVLTVSATSSQLSALETRQVKVLLSKLGNRLENSDSKMSLSQLQSQIQCELAGLEAVQAASLEIPLSQFWIQPQPPQLLTPHLAAQLSGTRTNAYLE